MLLFISQFIDHSDEISKANKSENYSNRINNVCRYFSCSSKQLPIKQDLIFLLKNLSKCLQNDL